MLYVEVTLSDLQQDLALAHANPRHLTTPAEKRAAPRSGAGLAGVTDRFTLSKRSANMCLKCSVARCRTTSSAVASAGSLNRLTKIVAETRKLTTP